MTSPGDYLRKSTSGEFEMAERIYLDACIFIELLQKSRPERLEQCEELWKSAKKGTVEVVTSTLTITEVFKPPGERLNDDDSRVILEFFEDAAIHIRTLDRRTAEEAHRIARQYNLSCNDAVHIATAVLHQVSAFYTYDGMKGKRKGLLKHDGKIQSLRIETPPDIYKGTLFDPEKLPTPINPAVDVAKNAAENDAPVDSSDASTVEPQ